MSGVSKYPISQALKRIVLNSGYSPFGFLLAMRVDPEALLPDLNSWLDKGEGDEATIWQIAVAHHDDAAQLWNALAETKAMRAANVDPVALEQARIKASFKPYIHAEGERRVPNGITIFAVSGGHDRWTTINVPQWILDLEIEKQLVALRELMLGFKRRNQGVVPFFGRLAGFKFIRFDDYYEFDADGRLIGHVEEPFHRSVAWAELR